MLNEYYQNVGWKGFFQRYGLVNGLRRGGYLASPLHFVPDYEMRKVLWQKKAAARVRRLLAEQDADPEGLAFSPHSLRNPIWVYWDQGMEAAPELVRQCHASLLRHSSREVIVLSRSNLSEYVTLPPYILDKVRSGSIPMAGFTDLLRFALLEHYGGTWVDATLFFTDRIPEEILTCSFFAFRNALGLLDNPVLYPAWFLHAEAGSGTMRAVRNMAFAYWRKENHVVEYLLPNLILTEYLHAHPEIEKKMPYMGSDYSEYLVRQLGEDYDPAKFAWICRLTGIHKLTYKLDPAIDRPNSFYRHLMTGEL